MNRPPRGLAHQARALIAVVAAAQGLAAQAPVATAPLRPVGTVSELMVDVIYPTSDAVLYILTRTPETEQDWQALQTKALMLAEAGTLLTLPGRTRPGQAWITEARAMHDAGAKAYRAAQARDLGTLAELNEPLYKSCVNCHRTYRPTYGRGRSGGLPQP